MTLYSNEGLMRPVEGGAFVAASAVLCGDVSLGAQAGVWFGCVLRGDDAPLVVGPRTNIQDLSMMHADPGVPNVLGADVTVGHGCVLHGAAVADRCLIGMGAVLLAGSRIGEESIIGAGAVVREDFEVPPRSLVLGVPGRVVRAVTDEEVEEILRSVRDYVEKVRQYLSEAAG
ncbi:MAG: gamma carbonic anhydrase family protein [Planctomycetota bacterium]|jgi:carbonic anhydrase/acetyltransferase-like protein (isoleucine patch superfamily)|nr:gamma carbonic anhydrase family protein [Planctomycetota bacterium]MDP6763841.1 gamma carbonic anhydrase family protein [Planctomycetota bacterium]MDP6988829.1 gamma carbonic anhydrase family protein [Planctomycetota bacterium]